MSSQDARSPAREMRKSPRATKGPVPSAIADADRGGADGFAVDEVTAEVEGVAESAGGGNWNCAAEGGLCPSAVIARICARCVLPAERLRTVQDVTFGPKSTGGSWSI